MPRSPAAGRSRSCSDSSDTGAHILQAVLFAIGVFIMVAFIRAAQRVEPFTRRA